MVLYRYMKSHWLETLETERFKAAKLTDFNDPFEGRGRCKGVLNTNVVKNIIEQDIGLCDVKDRLKEVQEQKGEAGCSVLLNAVAPLCSKPFYDGVASGSMMNLFMYAICFSSCGEKDPRHKLMWAHYANGFRGVRIGVRFDSPDFPLYLDSVKYCDERPEFDLANVRSLENDEETRRFWIANLTTKSIEWAYEREYRILASDQNLEKDVDEKGKDIYFWHFDPKDIVSVDVGYKISEEDVSQLLDLRNKKYPGMTVRQVVLNEFDYGISYEDITRTVAGKQ